MDEGEEELVSVVPVLRIEVEGVKHAIMQHLGTSARDFNALVEEELNALDIEAVLRAEIRRQVPLVVRDAVTEAAKEISKSVTRRLLEDLRDELERIRPRPRVPFEPPTGA